jgi:hypothetical protein
MPAFIGAVGWPVLDRFRFGSMFAISPHGLFIAIGLWSARGCSGSSRRGGISRTRSLRRVLVADRRDRRRAGRLRDRPRLRVLLAVAMAVHLEGRDLVARRIAGATIANAINIRRFGLRFFQVADVLAAPLALGIAIGRIGDPIIGDHLGKPTSWLLAWKHEAGPSHRPSGVTDGSARRPPGDHLEIIRRGAPSSATASRRSRRAWASTRPRCTTCSWPGSCSASCGGSSGSRAAGLATLLFTIYYGCCRLLEDFLRIDKRFGPLTGSQWTALTVVLLSVAVWAYWAVSERPGPTTPGRAREAPANEPVAAEPGAT